MNKLYKYSNRLLKGVLVVIGSAAMFTACSDQWDDHYDAVSTADASKSLWLNISSNENLSNFASLLKQTGFYSRLDTTQTYTVWAPQNGTFDYSTISAENNSTIIKEFLENHIARYRWSVSGDISSSIMNLNGKMSRLVGNGNGYQFNGVSMKGCNQLSSNGILHQLNGSSTFLPNIYEYLDKKDFATDSIASFFHSYDITVFDKDKSLQGPIVDGKVTYLDSVTTKSNTLFATLGGAYINSEDSSYTMVIPNDKAWKDAYDSIKSAFTYIKKLGSTQLSNIDSLSDINTKMAIVNNLVFNNNENKYQSDSLVSTLGNVFKNGSQNKIFADSIASVPLSNGKAVVVNKFDFVPGESWQKEIKVEAEVSANIESMSGVGLSGQDPTVVQVGAQNPKVKGSVSNHRYMDFEPKNSSTNPYVVYDIPGALSAEYDIYVVFVPVNILSDNVASDLLDAKGNPKMNRAKFTLTYVNNKNMSTAYSSTVDINSTIIDSAYVGRVKFPVSYYGVDSEKMTLKILSAVKSNETGNYSREMRIDCILFEPVKH